jgi:hypothetical protein
MGRTKNEFQTIRSEGGLLPPDLLRRVVDAKGNLPGAKPEDYGLPVGERLNEAITQSWNRMRRHWVDFRAAARNLPEAEAGTGLTNDKWSVPLLRELGFGLLPTTPGPEIAGKTYAINRFFGTTAVHLVGCNLSLDRRAAGVRGATTNPHGLVQEFLNRSGNHLWAIVSNGLRFRVLRDNQALSRQSYLEFDLEAMFSGEVYSDFVLLWLMAHATRFAPQRENQPESCWLEQWTKVAEEDGTRALGDLRSGVEKALQILGEAFVSHPRNTALREALRTEDLSLNDFHGQLLRIVYRLIFLFVAEDRTLDGISLLHPLDDSDHGRQARDRYAANYSTARLRELASKIKGSRHGDLWQQFNLLVGSLSGDDRFEASRRHLALPTLGSFLWSPKSTLALNAANLQVGDGVELANGDFLESLRHLAFTRQGNLLRPVDYKNLGAEELGGVYESLLALTPQISGDGNRFTFAEFAGNERKTSGSYYTPDSLVQCLLDSALDPVVEEAIKGKNGVDAEKAILSLKVCDPAVGSGHFLVGAAHRLARHLARVRANAQGESEPSPLLYQHALRDVIGRCLYGVDINPMSAELCRVGLWLEALEPGKPLSFLDHHIQVGNSLLGTTPALLAKGIPDEAFTPIEGDDRNACAELKRRNRAANKSLGPLFERENAERAAILLRAAKAIDDMPDDTPDAILNKSQSFTQIRESKDYLNAKRLADAWCAAFVLRKYFPPSEQDARFESKTAYGITQGKILELAHDGTLADDLSRDVDNVVQQYQFFHWHIAYPEVFAAGGFDVILGNPPWERVKLQEKEWFSNRVPEIANAPNAAARKRLIEGLKSSDPTMYQQFLYDSRKAEGESHLMRNSGRYPLCGRGDINVYTVFAEGMRSVLNPRGRVGVVLPSGIATDDTTKFFFQDVVETNSLRSLYDFENREAIFPGVHRSYKFCLFTAGSPLVSQWNDSLPPAEFAFFCLSVIELNDPNNRFALSPEDIALLNPNTRTCPIFRSRRDAELTKAIYRRVPVLIREASDGQPEENPWGVKFLRMFDMSNDSQLFRTREQLESDGWVLDGNRFKKANEEFLPLYEQNLINLLNHRYASFKLPNCQINANTSEVVNEKRLADAAELAVPRYWVAGNAVANALAAKNVSKDWFIAFRRSVRSTDYRTALFCVIPITAIGDSIFLILHSVPGGETLIGGFASYVFDFVSRQSIGGENASFFIIKQLPTLSPELLRNSSPVFADKPSINDWLLARVLELTYTAWDLEPFARDCGYDGPPFRWDEERRFILRAELDAAFFQLYLRADEQGDWVFARKADGCPCEESPKDLAHLKANFPTPRDAVSYIMDTFPIVRRKDEERFEGDYRTKRVILEIYDAMQESIRTRKPYQTRLDPPPGPPAGPLPEWLPGSPRPAKWPFHIHPPRGVERD